MPRPHHHSFLLGDRKPVVVFRGDRHDPDWAQSGRIRGPRRSSAFADRRPDASSTSPSG